MRLFLQCRNGLRSRPFAVSPYLKRSSYYPVRHFHPSQSRQLFEDSLLAAHNVFQTVHATGLPWALTIPAVAFLVKFGFSYPLQRISRKAGIVRRSLGHLTAANKSFIYGRTRAAQQPRKEGESTRTAKSEAVERRAAARELKRSNAALYRRWGCQVYKIFLPILQVPVWLVVIETLRRMAGQDAGILGRLTGWMTGDVARTGPDGEPLLSPRVIPVEHTLSSEGALWFPDLLVPDPTLQLPLILSAAVFTTVWIGSKPPDPGVRLPRWQRGLRNGLLIGALALFPVTLQVPSAIMIYWTTTASLGTLQHLYIDRTMPIPPANAIPVCKPRMIIPALETGTATSGSSATEGSVEKRASEVNITQSETLAPRSPPKVGTSRTQSKKARSQKKEPGK